MMEIINRLLDKLTGFYFWFALVLLIIGLAGWFLLGQTQKAEQETAKRQLKLAGLIVAVYFLGVFVYSMIFSPSYTFPEDVAGILVMQIEGDDEKNSLQHDLVSTLNTQLSREKSQQKIEVRAFDKTVTESMGLAEAHKMARKIGKDYNAKLVVWGTRAGDKKFHPRLTVVDDKPCTVIAGDGAMASQMLGDVNLPNELVDEPISLTHFISGYDFLDRKDYTSALAEFEATLKRPVADSTELNDIRFYAGTSHLLLAQSQNKDEMDRHLQLATSYYDTVSNFYNRNELSIQWAVTQNNLGITYALSPKGDRDQNLRKAIAIFDAALQIFTKKNFPLNWAGTENNLGVAYLELYTGDHDRNHQNAIAMFEAVLRVNIKKYFPIIWAIIQNNLGTAYANLSTGNRNENLQKAIAAYNAAFRIFNENDFPVAWAMTQNNLGVSYRTLRISNRGENLQKAVFAFEAALRVFNKNNFSLNSAVTQNNLSETQSLLNSAEEAWVRHYASGRFPGHDEITAMTVDEDGNVYVTGYSSNPAFGLAYLTIKYNSSGKQIWTVRYGGTGNGDDVALAIQVDASKNVYVTGKSWSGTSYDYATIKYNSAGDEQWVVRYNGPGNDDDQAKALAVDKRGNVYVTGTSPGAGTFDDYATIKYNSIGNEEWVTRYNGSRDSIDQAIALALDDSGNVYVTGVSIGAGTSGDYATIKYASSGKEKWAIRYNGSENSSNKPPSLWMDWGMSM